MQIIIHRGTHQIGGCVTEIDSNGAKVFIDFGSNLPGHASQEPSYPIAGLTVSDGSKSALFLTHYHGDHVGRLGEFPLARISGREVLAYASSVCVGH